MKTKLINFLIILFGGFFGIHYFLSGNKTKGFLYLFTLGGFGIGYLIDTWCAFFKIFSNKEVTSLLEKKDIESKAFYIKLNHLIGLNFPEDTPCLIGYSKENITFKANNVEYSLPIERIKDISKKSSTEIQQQYVSSVGGAAAGALLFGGLGAIIGGRAKKKNIKKITNCLIITYLKDEEIKYISFDISAIDEFAVNNLIKLFKKENNSIETTSIEL